MILGQSNFKFMPVFSCGCVYRVGYILVCMIWGGLYFSVCPCHPTFLINNEHSLIGSVTPDVIHGRYHLLHQEFISRNCVQLAFPMSQCSVG